MKLCVPVLKARSAQGQAVVGSGLPQATGPLARAHSLARTLLAPCLVSFGTQHGYNAWHCLVAPNAHTPLWKARDGCGWVSWMNETW